MGRDPLPTPIVAVSLVGVVAVHNALMGRDRGREGFDLEVPGHDRGDRPHDWVTPDSNIEGRSEHSERYHVVSSIYTSFEDTTLRLIDHRMRALTMYRNAVSYLEPGAGGIEYLRVYVNDTHLPMVREEADLLLWCEGRYARGSLWTMGSR